MFVLLLYDSDQPKFELMFVETQNRLFMTIVLPWKELWRAFLTRWPTFWRWNFPSLFVFLSYRKLPHGKANLACFSHRSQVWNIFDPVFRYSVFWILLIWFLHRFSRNQIRSITVESRLKNHQVPLYCSYLLITSRKVKGSGVDRFSGLGGTSLTSKWVHSLGNWGGANSE